MSILDPLPETELKAEKPSTNEVATSVVVAKDPVSSACPYCKGIANIKGQLECDCSKIMEVEQYHSFWAHKHFEPKKLQIVEYWIDFWPRLLVEYKAFSTPLYYGDKHDSFIEFMHNEVNYYLPYYKLKKLRTSSLPGTIGCNRLEYWYAIFYASVQKGYSCAQEASFFQFFDYLTRCRYREISQLGYRSRIAKMFCAQENLTPKDLESAIYYVIELEGHTVLIGPNTGNEVLSLVILKKIPEGFEDFFLLKVTYRSNPFWSD